MFHKNNVDNVSWNEKRETFELSERIHSRNKMDEVKIARENTMKYVCALMCKISKVLLVGPRKITRGQIFYKKIGLNPWHS